MVQAATRYRYTISFSAVMLVALESHNPPFFYLAFTLLLHVAHKKLNSLIKRPSVFGFKRDSSCHMIRVRVLMVMTSLGASTHNT